jgi:hypothetical protein
MGVGKRYDSMGVRGEWRVDRDSVQRRNGGCARDAFDKHEEI